MPWDARPGKSCQIPLWPPETVAPNHIPRFQFGPKPARQQVRFLEQGLPPPARYALWGGLIEVVRHLPFYLHMRRYARAEARPDVRRVEVVLISVDPHLNVFQLPSTRQSGGHRSPAASGYIRGFPRKQRLVSRLSLGASSAFTSMDAQAFLGVAVPNPHHRPFAHSGPFHYTTSRIPVKDFLRCSSSCSPTPPKNRSAPFASASNPWASKLTPSPAPDAPPSASPATTAPSTLAFWNPCPVSSNAFPSPSPTNSSPAMSKKKTPSSASPLPLETSSSEVPTSHLSPAPAPSKPKRNASPSPNA